jgi:rhodanese-related sulfurtransferase
MDIETNSRDELKAKLDNGDDSKLVTARNEWTFDGAHIPESLNICSVEDGARLLDIDDGIVLYRSDVAYVASQMAYRALIDGGYRNVRRYSGGLGDWATAGHALDGHSVDV